MRIAICDDEYTARDEIEALVVKYFAGHNAQADYTCFENYAALEPHIDEYDLFLLDYLMPGVNGMEFAEKIRKDYGPDKLIIFITQYDEIVYDAFTVQTHRFLTKPVNEEKFNEAIDSALKQIAGNRLIAVQFDGCTTAVKLSEIYYVEIRYKELYICTESEQILCRRSIKSVEQEIDSGCFFRVHRSYLVNMKNIRSFNNKRIEFPSGETIPVSSRKYAEFCRAYLKMK